MVTTHLPAALSAALNQRRLAIVAGAGISIWSPSSLPGWFAFNEIVLDEVRKLAIRAAPNGRLAAEIERLTLEAIGSKDFSDALVNDLMGSAYFEILRSLDARQPNACHRAIADLAMRRGLRAIVTTNFDTLFENAFRVVRGLLAVLSTPADYVREYERECMLLKLHGTARRGAGLIDTVRQKMRGLHQLVRARVADIVANSHVLVLGFSGDDLSFGADYLALKAIRSSSPGITWIVRPRTEPMALVRKTVARAGARGAILHADLGDVLSRVSGRPLKLALDGARRKKAESQIRAAARHVLARERPVERAGVLHAHAGSGGPHRGSNRSLELSRIDNSCERWRKASRPRTCASLDGIRGTATGRTSRAGQVGAGGARPFDVPERRGGNDKRQRNDRRRTSCGGGCV